MHLVQTFVFKHPEQLLLQNILELSNIKNFNFNNTLFVLFNKLR
jgi:hypothetical protein